MLSHLTLDGIPPEPAERGQAVYRNSSAPLVPRSRAETARFFAGYDLVEPGLVATTRWRPEGEPETVDAHGYAGVGVRR